MRRFKRRIGSRNKKERRAKEIQRNKKNVNTISSGQNQKKDQTDPHSSKTTAISSFKPKGKGGRKSKYNDDFPLLAQGFAREGLNDKEIALKLGINVSTLYEYQKEYKEFSEAIYKGKAPVDTKVENALLKLCLGSESEEVSVEYDPAKKNGGEPVVRKVKKTTKEILPNPVSCFFWLTNRKKDKWKNTHKIDAVISVKPMAMKDLLESEAAAE